MVSKVESIDDSVLILYTNVMIENFRRTIIIGVSLIAGSFLIFWIVAYFGSGAITAQVEKIYNYKTAIKSHSDLIEELANQKASNPEMEKYDKAISVIFPTKDELVNLPAWLDGLARARNVNAVFSFGGEATQSKNGEAGYVGFTLNANGDYANLADFLRDVELTSPKYTISFDNFDLKRNAGNYGAAIGGKIFFR